MSYTELSLLEFQRRFSTEEACQAALEQAHWPEGFVCPRCGHHKASRVATRRLLQCSAWHHQASVTAGTIFHKTRTAWTMLHKLRKAMAQRDARYTLTGSIEMDNAYFGGPAAGKRGRGAANKTPAVVMVENRGEHAGFLAIKTVTTVDKQQVDAAASAKIAAGQHIHTDGLNAYNGLEALGHDHQAETVPPHQAHEKLPWVHIAIANAKRFLLGTYHGVSHKYLQAYLDEFCYRFNRRSWEPTLTSRLLTACLVAKPITLAELKA